MDEFQQAFDVDTCMMYLRAITARGTVRFRHFTFNPREIEAWSKRRQFFSISPRQVSPDLEIRRWKLSTFGQSIIRDERHKREEALPIIIDYY